MLPGDFALKVLFLFLESVALLLQSGLLQADLSLQPKSLDLQLPLGLLCSHLLLPQICHLSAELLLFHEQRAGEVRVGQRLCCVWAPRRVHREHSTEQVYQCRVGVRWQGKLLPTRGQRQAGGPGRTRKVQFEQHEGKRKDVRRWGRPLPLEEFRRHVVHRPRHGAPRRCRPSPQGPLRIVLGDVKITDLGLQRSVGPVGEEDVGGLEVTVHHVRAMNVLHAPQQFAHQGLQLVLVKRSRAAAISHT